MCTFCNKRIEAVKEELHSLKAELRHLAVMRSTELGKKIQLESELHLMRLQMPPPSQKALKEAEALVMKQERRADAKNERFQQIQARIEELHQIDDVADSEASSGGSKLVRRPSSTRSVKSARSARSMTSAGSILSSIQSVPSRASRASSMAAAPSVVSGQSLLSSDSPGARRALSPTSSSLASASGSQSSPILSMNGAVATELASSRRTIQDYELLSKGRPAYTVTRDKVKSKKSPTSVTGSGFVLRAGEEWVDALYTPTGERCTLKAISLSNIDARQRVEREIAIRSVLRPPAHPALAPIDAVFLVNEGIPEHVGGNVMCVHMGLDNSKTTTMHRWLCENRKPWDVQSVFHQLASALAYLHSHHVAHRDLGLRTVLLSSEDETGSDATHGPWRPFLTEFGGAIVSPFVESASAPLSEFEVSYGDTETVYLSPEVMRGDTPTTKADLWAVGVMLFKAVFGLESNPIAVGGASAVIPDHPNPRLRELLAKLLAVNPADRITSQDAQRHPYFTVSFAHDMWKDGNLIHMDEKVELFRSHLSSMPRGDDANPLYCVRVKRERIVDDVLRLFSRLSKQQLLKKFIVMYHGESGVDAGGLTKDMFCRFFADVTKPEHGLFETCSGTAGAGSLVLPGEAATSLKRTRRLVASSQSASWTCK